MKTFLVSGLIFIAGILSFAEHNAAQDCIVFDGVYKYGAERVAGGFYYTADGLIQRIPEKLNSAFNEKAPSPMLSAGQGDPGFPD
ncbi:MAG: hypothetical protein EHM28_01285 [Spirochaetaceae bacterium]|nr:MAG: hypothetical protein EHM28_01285 [Spirochaetaceae bacterium]